MHDTAYIAIGDDGHITLFWGDGTEDVKEVILHGPRPRSPREMVDIVAEVKAWAEDNGYTVIVPAYDPNYTDIELELTAEDERSLSPDEIDDLLDELYWAEE